MATRGWSAHDDAVQKLCHFCMNEPAVDAKIAAAEKRVLSAVAEALRAGGTEYRSNHYTASPSACERAADLLLSPPVPPAVPSVPEVRWEIVARAAAFSFGDYDAIQAFARAVVNGEVVISPGGKS